MPYWFELSTRRILTVTGTYIFVAPLTGLEVYLSISDTPDGNLLHTLSNTEYEMIPVTRSNDYQFVIVKSTTTKFLIICEIQVYTQGMMYFMSPS